MAWANYTQIQEDAKTLLLAIGSPINEVFCDADERDVAFNNAPLVDIRWNADSPGVRVGQTYYNEGSLDFEVVAYSLESQRAAAMVRNSILSAIADKLRANPHFSSTLETVKIGPINFDAGQDRKTGAFVAAAVMRVYVESYVD